MHKYKHCLIRIETKQPETVSHNTPIAQQKGSLTMFQPIPSPTTTIKALAVTTLTLITLNPPALAQHSGDVEFGYANNQIQIVSGDQGRVFESAFDTSGLFEQNTDDPGFFSGAAEGLSVNPGDTIDYNILGPLGFHDGTGFATAPTGAAVLIEDNPGGTLAVSETTTGPITGPGVIAVADGGGAVHAHIDFTLDPETLDTPEFGAYGLLMQLTTDASGVADSDPFYIVFNFGLTEPVFENAVGDFASIVPEPASLVVAGIGGLMMLTRRRR